MGLHISMSCSPFTRQYLGGKCCHCLKRVIDMTRVIITVLYGLGSNVTKLCFTGSRETIVIMHMV